MATAFRFFLKAAHQIEGQGIPEEEKEAGKWKGGFSKAYNQLFRVWPSPNQSKRFEKLMRRWLKKTGTTEQAYIRAFNAFLGQKNLNSQELQEVIEEGKRSFKV